LDLPSEISNKISKLKCCVLIPTYNNEKTLERVILGVLNYTNNIIIINDGSTDSTKHILKKFDELEQIHFPKNKGKGSALRAGFKKATKDGFDFAITIDSDGQHYPNDIPVFIDEILKDKNSLLIGSRNMTQDTVPKGSSFGNKFSNFWFWAETGVKLTDTQSGYRLYPLHIIKNIRFRTTKFEFEIENIVKASWKGVTIKNVPVKVLYDPDERVTHFRPYKDFARITVLNIWLLIIAFLYIKPRDLFRKIKKKSLKRFLTEDLLKSSDSPKKKALSILLGTFIGLTPFWGFHGILALSLSVPLKLNKAIAFAFSNISIPPFIPFIVIGSIKIGSYILGTNVNFNFSNFSENLKSLTKVKEYLIGTFVLAAVVSIIFTLIGYKYLLLRKKSD